MWKVVGLDAIRWNFLSAQGSGLVRGLDQLAEKAEVVKNYPKRTILHFPGFYLKEVRYKGIRSFVKLIFGGNACKEGRVSRELASRGVPVPLVLAYGEERRKGFMRRDLLLTEEVRGRSLLQVFDGEYGAWAPSEKRHFIRCLALFWRSLHDAGVAHKDPHLGNVLYLPDEDPYRFVILDTDRVSLKRRKLSDAERISNLAMMHTLQEILSSTEILRFLRAYGFEQDGKGRKLLSELRKVALSHSRKIWRKRAGRCLFDNSSFVVERREGFKIHRLRSPEIEGVLEELLRDPDGILESGEILKAGNTVRAARVELNGKSYFLKRYNCKGFSYRFRNAFRRSRAVRTWYAFASFTVRRLPVPTALVCMEERHFRLLGRSYVLSEFAQNTQKFGRWWPSLNDSEKERTLSNLGGLLGRMHWSGCLHGDLKWDNILVQRDRDKQKIILIDLDGARIMSRVGFDRALKDLRRFLRDLEVKNLGQTDSHFLTAVWEKWLKNKRRGTF